MNIKLVLGISLALFLGYMLFRQFLEHSAIAAAYRRELQDLITNEKYQVKGKFE
jgi:hypothetical protein